VLVVIFIIFHNVSCSENNVAATSTPIPTNTPSSTPTLTPTSTPKPTKAHISTPSPVFINLISPFSSTCGDGNPIIWSNDAYNWVWYSNCSDDTHGHVDWLIPAGCDIDNQGDVVAPVSGTLTKIYEVGVPVETNGLGAHFYLNKGLYPTGVLEMLKFVGVPDPELSKIDSMHYEFGHITPIVSEGSHLNQGQPLGEIVKLWNGQRKLAIKFVVSYKGIGDLVVAPSLLPHTLPDGSTLLPMLDGTTTNWKCQSGSPYDCVPELKDYAPTCKLP
jgi:hypothetical protein